ncbi:MAG: efflux RND transporter permease subunit, partial [Porticoccaceae bacterium]|nr:efflux RND transporter permease subunit [Porticoccaceae bacterium]
GNFRLQNPLGQSIYLQEVADVGLEQASNLIVRQNGQRKATVSLNVAEGYNLGDLVEEVRKVVDPIVLKKGFYATYGGQFEAQQEASKVIGTLGVVVVILILVLLTMALNSFKSALLVMLNLPLALIGGVLAVYLSEGNLFHNLGVLFGSAGHYVTPVLSIASLVGFITLFGIAVRSGILLVKQFQVLIEQEGLALKEAIVRGSLERLSPILMTALTAMLALIPMAAAVGKPGSELLAPLAIVVLGGLFSATLLNLLVVPAGYYWMFRSANGHNPLS